MKILLIIIVTFIIAFATSALYEFEFFRENPVRYGLVLLLIFVEFATAWFYIKSEIKTLGN